MHAHDEPHRDLWVRAPEELQLGPSCPGPPSLRTHSHHVVVLCVEGEGELRAGSVYRLRPGDLYLLPAGLPHQLRADEPLRAWGLSLCAGCVTDDALLEPFHRVRAGAAAVVRPTPAQRERLHYLLRALRDEQDADDAPIAHAIQRAAVGWLLAEVARCRAEDGGAALPELVRDALALIEAEATNRLSLTDLAVRLHRSPGHVTTALREATGCTAQGWITRFRMAEARRRLLHTDERVDVIAERVGYEDATHFIRTFRRHHDEQTPAAWRRAHRAT